MWYEIIDVELNKEGELEKTVITDKTGDENSDINETKSFE